MSAGLKPGSCRRLTVERRRCPKTNAGARLIAAEAGRARFHGDHADERTAINMTKRPVLITTEFRGVFFGWAEDTGGDTVTLTNARNCIFWPSENGGFMGLASDGPHRNARIVRRARPW